MGTTPEQQLKDQVKSQIQQVVAQDGFMGPDDITVTSWLHWNNTTNEKRCSPCPGGFDVVEPAIGFTKHIPTSPPNAATCAGTWDCSVEGQYCPPGVPGSSGNGFCCENNKWVAGVCPPPTAESMGFQCICVRHTQAN